ncbi:tektin-B1-like [Neocloeon triangulifer]|uniref:tektin-B1-like n=1 Tax=Neocloeon triangulifer TaxID=2078957 RepID=UPI00286F8B11|nr:tektin-B1-like [Neocloeon triangulifer]
MSLYKTEKGRPRGYRASGTATTASTFYQRGNCVEIFNNQGNQSKITRRISLVQEWQKNLQNSHAAAKNEKLALAEVKKYLETYVNEALLPPLDVVAQCLYLRDQRHPTELTMDPVTSQLKEELRVFELHKSKLSNLNAEAWDMIGQISDLIDALQFNISEQTAALDVDVSMLSLSIDSPGLALRPEPQRVPPKSSVPDSWLNHCYDLVEWQKKECTQSRTLREKILRAVEEARNENWAQQDETCTCFRGRIHEQKISIDRLKRQRDIILEEMEKVNQEIKQLELADQSLDLPRALCETRHEGRTARPAGPQRCQDDPQDELAVESATLAESQQKLQQKTAHAKAAYEALRTQLAKVEYDMEDKNAALALEMRCLASREQLRGGEDQITQSHSSRL